MPGQCLQMVGASGFRSDQETNEINRRAVERMKIDRANQTCENPEDRFCLGELAVRNGDPFAYARRPETFALQQGVKDFPRRPDRRSGRPGRSVLGARVSLYSP